MFRVQPTETSRTYRLAVAGLLMLSLAALAVTIWVTVDLFREQEIVRDLIRQLPDSAKESAVDLASELRWQFRLSILVVLNLVVTGFAMVLLWRAYRMSQESLRDIKALAGDILSSMDLAVVTTDLEGFITSMNRRGIELLSLGEERLGLPLTEASPDIPLEALRQESQSVQKRPLTRDFSVADNASTRTLRAFCQPLRSHANEEIGNIIQFHDVTDRVLIDEQMRRMERYMGLGSLAAGLHHEIKNPLAALSLHVQLLEEEIDTQEPSDEVQEMLGVIKSEVSRVGGVLENFRDFASLGQLNRSEVDLPKLVERQVRLIGPQAERQQIAIDIEVVPPPPPFIDADRVRLEQVLLNLLVNAMEAMPAGGTLTVRISVRQDTRPKVIRIEVIDTGPGIADNLLDRIFDPYFTTKSDGTGMGLALCDKIIRQHSGHLTVRTSPAGTTFEIALPIPFETC